MKKIKLIEVSSDLGGRKAGASMGMDAVRIASYRHNDTKDFYTRFENDLYVRITAPNYSYHLPYKHQFAKRIENIEPIYQQICKEVSKAILQNDFTLVISGDHSTAGGTIAGIKHSLPDSRIGVVWIDAHADVHNPYTSDSGNMHGMPVCTAIDDNNLECKFNDIDTETATLWEKLKSVGGRKDKVNMSDIVYVAIRDYERAENSLIKKYNNKIYKVFDIRQLGARETAHKIIKNLEHCDVIYISFDVDSMDPSVSGGTGTPFENGLFGYEAKELLKTLVTCDKVKCLEIAEINPLLDTKNMMANVVFSFVKSICRTIDFAM
jgi:arginase